MKKLIYLVILILFYSNIQAQDVYMCYKIEKGVFNKKTTSWKFKQFKDDIDMPVFIYKSKIRIRSDLYYIMEKQIIDDYEKNVICVNITTNRRAVIKIVHYYKENSLGLVTLIVEEPKNKAKKYYLTTY